MPPPTRETLLKPVRTLCTAFSSGSSPETLAAIFTQHTPTPLAHEHGLPALAPFLGRDFTGVDGIKRYFALVASELAIEAMEFEDEGGWVVDAVAMAVVVRGRARFVCRASGEGWDETFVYRVGVGCEGGVDGGELKVTEYRVWADTGAAYLARVGRLGGVLGGSVHDGGGGSGKKGGDGGGGHDKVD